MPELYTLRTWDAIYNNHFPHAPLVSAGWSRLMRESPASVVLNVVVLLKMELTGVQDAVCEGY